MKKTTDSDSQRRNRAQIHAEAAENAIRQVLVHAPILQSSFIQGIRCEVQIKSGEKTCLNSTATSKVHSNTQETQCNLLSFSAHIPPPTSFMAICAVEKAFKPTSLHSLPLCVPHLPDITFVPKFTLKSNSAELLDKIDQMPGSAGSQTIQHNYNSVSTVPVFERKGSKWSKYAISKELAPNVFVVDDDFGQKVVIKKLPHKAGCSGLPKEVLAGMILKHENVVSMKDYFQDEDSTYLVLEFIEGKDLFTFIQQRQFVPLDEEMARHVFIQLLEAVSYSHSVGVVHLDIKLENIIFSSDSKAKLIDFGLCDIVKTASEFIQCWVGSLDYACPEIYLRKPYEASKADVFSLGVVLYILLCGELPFSREERTDCLRLFAKHPQIVWPSQCKASPEAKDLLNRMLEFNGEQRISLDNIFHHKWVKLPALDD